MKKQYFELEKISKLPTCKMRTEDSNNEIPAVCQGCQ